MGKRHGARGLGQVEEDVATLKRPTRCKYCGLTQQEIQKVLSLLDKEASELLNRNRDDYLEIRQIREKLT